MLVERPQFGSVRSQHPRKLTASYELAKSESLLWIAGGLARDNIRRPDWEVIPCHKSACDSFLDRSFSCPRTSL